MVEEESDSSRRRRRCEVRCLPEKRVVGYLTLREGQWEQKKEREVVNVSKLADCPT